MVGLRDWEGAEAPIVVSAGGVRWVPGRVAWGPRLTSAVVMSHIGQVLFEEQTGHVSWLSKAGRNQHEKSVVGHEDYVVRFSYLSRSVGLKVMTAFSTPPE